MEFVTTCDKGYIILTVNIMIWDTEILDPNWFYLIGLQFE